MHDLILKALSSVHGVSSEEDLSEEDLSGFLRRLKPAAKYLWHAYRSSSANVSYRKLAVQAIYMLRYFPQYAEVTRVVLDELHRKEVLPFQEELLYISLFGCGPAPELCGIMQFLKSRFPRSEMIIAHLLDIASEGWMHSRQITLDHLVPTLWDKQLFEVHAIYFDLSQFGSTAVLSTTNGSSNAIGEASLMIFQNCLNELPRSMHKVATENILALLQMMKPGKSC
jgi:hypothetical protein